MKYLKIKNIKFELSIDFLALKKIRAAIMLPSGEPLDLLNIVKIKSDGTLDSSLLDILAGNPLLLVELLYVLFRKQLDEKSITEEDFYRMISGEDIETAVDLVMEELIDFFPTAKSRVLRRFWDAVKTIELEAREELQEKLNSAEESEKLEKRIRGALSASARESSE